MKCNTFLQCTYRIYIEYYTTKHIYSKSARYCSVSVKKIFFYFYFIINFFEQYFKIRFIFLFEDVKSIQKGAIRNKDSQLCD